MNQLVSRTKLKSSLILLYFIQIHTNICNSLVATIKNTFMLNINTDIIVICIDESALNRNFWNNFGWNRRIQEDLKVVEV